MNWFDCSSLCLFSSKTCVFSPSIYFILRFRQEVREERLGSAASPVLRAFNIASSSYIMALILLMGMVAALPLLLLFKIFSTLVSSSDGDVDTSILSRSATTDNKGRSTTRRRGAYMEHRDSINLHAKRLEYLSSLNDE